MKIVIPGGSGQVGTMLACAFLGDGHEVVILIRHVRRGPGRVAPGTRTGNDFSFLFPRWPEAASDLCR